MAYSNGFWLHRGRTCFLNSHRRWALFWVLSVPSSHVRPRPSCSDSCMGMMDMLDGAMDWRPPRANPTPAYEPTGGPQITVQCTYPGTSIPPTVVTFGLSPRYGCATAREAHQLFLRTSVSPSLGHAPQGSHLVHPVGLLLPLRRVTGRAWHNRPRKPFRSLACIRDSITRQGACAGDRRCSRPCGPSRGSFVRRHVLTPIPDVNRFGAPNRGWLVLASLLLFYEAPKGGLSDTPGTSVQFQAVELLGVEPSAHGGRRPTDDLRSLFDCEQATHAGRVTLSVEQLPQPCHGQGHATTVGHVLYDGPEAVS